MSSPQEFQTAAYSDFLLPAGTVVQSVGEILASVLVTVTADGWLYAMFRSALDLFCPFPPPSLECMDRVSPPPAEYPRDPIYFMEDGNCTLEIEKTLFKVHSHYLSPRGENTYFTAALATQTGVINLPRGNISELRAFLDFAYPSIPDENLQKLCDTVTFTRNYGLNQYHKQAVEARIEATKRNRYRALEICPVQTYISLLSGPLGPEEWLLPYEAKRVWAERVKRGELSMQQALDVSEAMNLDTLRDALYRNAATTLMDPHRSLPDLGPDSDSHRQLRLLRGALRMAAYWDDVVATLPPLEHGLCHCATCFCAARWPGIWHRALRSVLDDAPTKGIEARLGHLCSCVRTEAGSNPCPAVVRAIDSVVDLRNTFNAQVSVYFL
ncbi:hypothetical protein C8R47DRAFT_1080570 [Mycena vitilis]|nr:hypothetical protein C8R47DRAFT_1080570 [Mycena vitilis]